MTPSIDPKPGGKSLLLHTLSPAMSMELFLQPKPKPKPKPEAPPQRMALFNLAFIPRFVSASPNRGVRLTRSPLISSCTLSPPPPPPPRSHKDPPPPPQPPPRGPTRRHELPRASTRRSPPPTRRTRLHTRVHAPYTSHPHAHCSGACVPRAALRGKARSHALSRASLGRHGPPLLPQCRAPVAYAPPRSVVDAVHRFKLRLVYILAVQPTTSAFLTPSSRTHSVSEPILCTSNVPPHALYPSGYPRYDFGRISFNPSPHGESEYYFGTPPCASPSWMFLWLGCLTVILYTSHAVNVVYVQSCLRFGYIKGQVWYRLMCRIMCDFFSPKGGSLTYDGLSTRLQLQTVPLHQASILCLGSYPLISRFAFLIFHLLLYFCFLLCFPFLVGVAPALVRVLVVYQYSQSGYDLFSRL